MTGKREFSSIEIKTPKRKEIERVMRPQGQIITIRFKLKKVLPQEIIDNFLENLRNDIFQKYGFFLKIENIKYGED